MLVEIIIGSRTSELAMWQTHHLRSKLQAAWPDLVVKIESFVTKGDKTLDKPLPQIGGKGLFTLELEDALRNGRIHLAIHSLKDLPVADSAGLTLGAIIGRADVRDVLVAKNGWTLDTLPHGAVVGTSSLRRQAQLLAIRPDLHIQSMRGNVGTRVRKVLEGAYDAAVLAAAGITRLGLGDHITQWLPLTTMLPAPGQGALAVQCRADNSAVRHLLQAIDQPDVRACVTAERSFLYHLAGGCSAPVAAYAIQSGSELQLTGFVAATDGKTHIKATQTGQDAWRLGKNVAQTTLAQGAGEILNNQQTTSYKQPATNNAPLRVVITRSEAQAASFADKLAASGAVPVLFPVIQFTALPLEPLDEALARFKQYDWIVFTSVNAVDFFFRRVDELGLALKMPQVATVGSATAVSLQSRHIPINFTPDEFTGEALAAGLGNLTGQRVLLPRAKIGRPQIIDRLRRQGAMVDDVALYDTVTAVPTPHALAQLQQGFDLITFTSPSSVRNFLKIISETKPEGFQKNFRSLLEQATIACIGPVTADEATKNGLNVAVIPSEYTIDGLIQAISKHF